MTQEGVEDLLEQTHEVARSDHERRLATDLAALLIPPHLVAIMRLQPLPRIRLMSEWLREERIF